MEKTREMSTLIAAISDTDAQKKLSAPKSSAEVFSGKK